MNRNGELHTLKERATYTHWTKVGFFDTEKIHLPPTHSGHCTEYAIPAGFCVLGYTFSGVNIKKIQMLEIFIIQQGHAKYLIITEEWEEALSVLTLCHHKDPGMKRPDV